MLARGVAHAQRGAAFVRVLLAGKSAENCWHVCAGNGACFQATDRAANVRPFPSLQSSLCKLKHSVNSEIATQIATRIPGLHARRLPPIVPASSPGNLNSCHFWVRVNARPIEIEILSDCWARYVLWRRVLTSRQICNRPDCLSLSVTAAAAAAIPGYHNLIAARRYVRRRRRRHPQTAGGVAAAAFISSIIISALGGRDPHT